MYKDHDGNRRVVGQTEDLNWFETLVGRLVGREGSWKSVEQEESVSKEPA